MLGRVAPAVGVARPFFVDSGRWFAFNCIYDVYISTPNAGKQGAEIEQ